MSIAIELAEVQRTLESVDKLSNCIQKIDDISKVREIAYTIHRLIEHGLTSDTAREVQKWQIEANKELFIKIELEPCSCGSRMVHTHE